MRVLLATGLYPPEIGGPATYAALLEERLPAHDIHVTVMPFSSVRRLVPGARHFVYMLKIIRAARTHDLIMVQDTVSTGLPAALAAAFARKKLIVRVPGDYAWEQGVQRCGITDSLDAFQKHSYGMKIAMWRMIQRYVVRRAYKIIAPSEYLKGIIAQWAPGLKIDVIYNGVETEHVIAVRKENLIVSSGRLVPWKGFEELIDVVKLHPEWRLIILGDGPLKSKLAQKIGGDKLIELRGSVSREEALRTFAEAAVFVLNSRYEGLSHTLVEAMAMATPVIATDVGGNPEVVNETCGIVIPAEYPQVLERAIENVLNDANLRRTLADAAQARAKDFSVDKTVEKTAQLLHACT